LAACGGIQQGRDNGQLPIGAQGALTHNAMRQTVTYESLYSFGNHPDGDRPSAGLTKLKGTLYGTTSEGGSSNDGTAFRITSGGAEDVVHSFHGGTADGAGPGDLINVNGTLFGTTAGGGDSGPCSCGVAYSVTPTGTETVLHRFRGGTDGAHSSAGLIILKGTLYGTTLSGGDGCGSVGCGTVFSMTPAGSERVLYSFKAQPDGNYPVASLVAVGLTLYGTTNLGGGSGCYYRNGCGTVFSVNLQGTEKILYRFKGGSDGAYPDANVIVVNGVLYGTTSIGGYQNEGTAFSVTTSGVEKVLHRFGHGPDGRDPEGPLLDVNGTLYGTTYSGGSGRGTVFSMSTAGKEKVLYGFLGGSADGSNPQAGLVDLSGTLYGTTFYGGRDNHGTVFALTP
jgi:uncharacterized repeat protein (TIGR03803 family)